jgi:hypothetical protein
MAESQDTLTWRYYAHPTYNFIGQRFGRLVCVASIAGSHNKSKMWVCRCDCGTTTTAATVALRKGLKRSCGCLRTELKHVGRPDESSFKALFYRYKRQASLKGVAFSLTEAEFRELTSSPCFYCAEPPSQLNTTTYRNVATSRLPYKYNGVDRRDSGKGYSRDNTVACCGPCNIMKMKLAEGDFIERCHKIAATHPRAN